jgi:peptidoglycan/LPS O-acetylase OafA/YrhL
MTGIILRGIEEKNFLLLKFYVSRANRIIPALAILCLVLLGGGWLYLTPLDYMELGKHVVSSMGFFSNITYWRESGYFDAVAHEKWLLHTWSLSVEWQFYIIYPVVLVAMGRFITLKTLKVTILVAAVIGFAFSVVATYLWPNPAYFLLPTRAWEMMLGGVAYIYPFKLEENKKKLVEKIGLVLIVASYIFISKESLWPGYLALIPVLGTYLLIQAQRDNSIITSNIFFQKLGKWSYSIYLWHWPIVVLSVKYAINFNIVIYLILTITFGYFSHKYFEINRIKYKFPLLLMAFFAAYYVYSTNGVSSRVNEKFQLNKTQFHLKYYGGSGYDANRFININATEQEYDFVFVGDSYGLQYSRTLEKKGVRLIGLFHHGCLILPNYSRFSNNKEDETCSEEYLKVKNKIINNNKPLLLSYSWDAYEKLLVKKGSNDNLNLSADEYFDILSSELRLIFIENGINRKYFILGVPQRSTSNAFECLVRTELIGFRLFNKCSVTQVQKSMKINYYLKGFSEKFNNVHFIDPNSFLCQSGKCLIVKDREPIHSDQSHLSIFGTPMVVDGFISYMNELSE